MITPKCPHCQIGLERRSNKGVFQYACPSCYGFTIHFGGLKKIMDPRDVKRLWESAASAPVSAVACSHCLKPMKTVFHGDTPTVELDVCERCNLVWLDTGEWGDVQKNNRTPERSAKSHYTEYAQALAQLEKEKFESARSFKIETADGDTPKWKLALAVLGLPVEEDGDQFHSTPWVTWSLVAACFTISILGFQNLEVITSIFGHSAAHPIPLRWITPFTAFFLHGSWMHLLGNMYFLVVFGDNVEDHLGKKNYLLLIAAATALGAILWDAYDPKSSVMPAVGASGGIAGLIAYYLLRFPHRRFVVMFFFRWISIPGILFGALFFLKDIVGAVYEVSGVGGGVAHLAHLGGALAGVLFAILLSPERQLNRM